MWDLRTENKIGRGVLPAHSEPLSCASAPVSGLWSLPPRGGGVQENFARAWQAKGKVSQVWLACAGVAPLLLVVV